MNLNKQIIILILVFLCAEFANAQENQYKEDFQFFWQSVNDSYAYFDKKQTDWNKVKEIYGDRALQVKDKKGFIRLLELALRELYDSHTQLNTNLSDSSRLVPSGTDIRAEWINNKAIITNLRRSFGAERSGLKVGMEIVKFNGKPIEESIKPFIGQSLRQTDDEVRNWALNALLAGDHITNRIIEARLNGKTHIFELDKPKSLLKNISYSTRLDFRRLENNLGYIKINNSLGDNSLIGLFDEALDKLKNTEGLILDLRETPSGGNSTVGRAILSRFIKSEKTFQKHSDPSEEKNWGVKRSWFEIVSPHRLVYEKPLVILVNHWTGSMGEGIAIGFDGMKRAKTVGTKMAGLNGALKTIELPNTKIRVSFPFEKIFHVSGQPREDFKPMVLVDKIENERDTVLQIGIEELKKALRKN